MTDRELEQKLAQALKKRLRRIYKAFSHAVKSGKER